MTAVVVDSYHALRAARGDVVTAVYHHGDDGFQRLAIDGLVPFPVVGDKAIRSKSTLRGAAVRCAESDIDIRALRVVALLQRDPSGAIPAVPGVGVALHVLQRVTVAGYAPAAVFAMYGVTVSDAGRDVQLHLVSSGFSTGDGNALFAGRLRDWLRLNPSRAAVVDVPLGARESLTPATLWPSIWAAAQNLNVVRAQDPGQESHHEFAVRMRQRRQREKENAGT